MTLWFLPLFCMRFGFLYKEFFVQAADAEFEFSRAIFRNLLLIFCTKKSSSNMLCIFKNQMYFWWMKKSVAFFERCVFFYKKTCYWFKVAQYLSEHDIAHNVFITRGSPLDDHNDLINYSAIKIFIWARHSIFGNKHPTDFCMAVCELGRHH